MTKRYSPSKQTSVQRQLFPGLTLSQLHVTTAAVEESDSRTVNDRIKAENSCTHRELCTELAVFHTSRPCAMCTNQTTALELRKVLLVCYALDNFSPRGMWLPCKAGSRAKTSMMLSGAPSGHCAPSAALACRMCRIK